MPASRSPPRCAHTSLRPPQARRPWCAAAASRTAAATPRRARAAAGAGAGLRAGRPLPGLRSSGLLSARAAGVMGRRRAPSPPLRCHIRTDSAPSLGHLGGVQERGAQKARLWRSARAWDTHADRGGGSPEARGNLGRRGAQEMQSAASAAMARARCAPMSAPAKAAAPRAGPPATSPIAIASRAPSCGAHSPT